MQEKEKYPLSLGKKTKLNLKTKSLVTVWYSDYNLHVGFIFPGFNAEKFH